MTKYEALTTAVRRMGSQSAMGRLLDVAQCTVWKWLNQTKTLPAEHVLKVEAATGVSRHDLRPDIYPRPAEQPYDSDLTPWDTGDYRGTGTHLRQPETINP